MNPWNIMFRPSTVPSRAAPAARGRWSLVPPGLVPWNSAVAWNSAVERRYALIACVPAKRTQAELHHEGMVDRYAATIGIISDVVRAQYDAVIDITDPGLILAELVVEDVVARRPHQYPVWRQFQSCIDENSLAPR